MSRRRRGARLITQSWRLVLDAWPEDGRIPVWPAPLQTLTAARVYDIDNNAQAVDTQSFVPDLAASQLIVAPWALTQPQRLAAGIELDVVCGYGDAATDVPEPLRQAIRLLVAHWYENRGLLASGARSARGAAGERGGAARALSHGVAVTRAPGDLNRRLTLLEPVETADDEGGVVRSYQTADHAVGAGGAAVGGAAVSAASLGAALRYASSFVTATT